MMNTLSPRRAALRDTDAPRSRWRSRSPWVVIAGLALALLAASCGGGTGAGGAGSGDGRDALTVTFSQEPANWNYLQNEATTIRSLLVLNVLEPLLDKQEDGSLEPLLAESYEVSDDGLEYTFTLREATFHDGAELSADDVVYSLEQSRASQLTDISGPYEPVTQIAKADDRSVVVTLSRPSQQFLEAMSSDSALIIPDGSVDSLQTSPIGTGPFSFQSWRHGAQVALERNEDYWGDKPAMRTVTWRFITDAQAAINALLAGDVDMIAASTANTAQVDSVASTPGFAEQIVAGSEIVYLSLNADDPAFADERVRQAVAYSLDRQAFIDGTTGFGEPTCVLVNPPTEPWNSDYCPYPHDPDKARELLTEAGGLGLTLHYTYLEGTENGVAIVTQGLEQAGFKVERERLDLATYIERVLTNGQYQLTHIAGPQQVDSWTCPGFFTHDCYAEFDDLLAQADRALDRTEWADLRREAVELQADRAFLIPAWTITFPTLHRDDLSGLKPFRSSSEVDLRGLQWSGG